MSGPWLHIVGVGEGGPDAFSIGLIERAKYIIGPKRLLQDLPAIKGQKLAGWRKGHAAMKEQIIEMRGSVTVILATGDPNWFGIGSTLVSQLNAKEYVIHPSVSGFQLAAIRMGWPMQNVSSISLHGRAVENLHPHILPKNRILALTSSSSTLGCVAQLLEQRGYSKSRLTVLENLGGDNERVRGFSAIEAARQKVGEFYILAIDCVAGENAQLLSAVPGLPDEAFCSDGQLTKREVRAATLAKLAPFPKALLWDVGAGCGSIGIEWLRAARGAKAICFERDRKRQNFIAENRARLGVPSLEIISGNAPSSFAGVQAPDAIFLGGEVANDELYEACLDALKPGGRMVANAVTLEGEQALYDRHERLGGELVRIDVSVAGKAGSYRIFTPRRAVTQWLFIKGHAS